MVSIDRAGEVETQLKKESGLKKSSLKGSQNVYVNTYEEEEHGYENFDRNAVTSGNGHYNNNNPYEDDVQTVHSEGVRSEMDPPPIPSGKRPTNGMMMADINDSTTLTLGDISEADDRVLLLFHLSVFIDCPGDACLIRFWAWMKLKKLIIAIYIILQTMPVKLL